MYSCDYKSVARQSQVLLFGSYPRQLERREKDSNPQSCYRSPIFKIGLVPLQHRGKTQSAGLEPASRRNGRLLSREFQYHYGTIAKVGRVGLEPTYPKMTDLQSAAIPILHIYPNTAYTVAADLSAGWFSRRVAVATLWEKRKGFHKERKNHIVYKLHMDPLGLEPRPGCLWGSCPNLLS